MSALRSSATSVESWLGPLPSVCLHLSIARPDRSPPFLGSLGVPALQVSSTLAARYSLRRKVIDHQSGTLRPIISFQTQKIPVLTALAQAFVMQAYQKWAAGVFRTSRDPRVQHAIASILKVVMIELAQAAHVTLGDRCGAQGIFEVNQLSAMHVSSCSTMVIHLLC
jgi:acyl-CoA oxidase